MAFVVGQQVPNIDAVFANRADNLLRLGVGHPRVVLAVHHQQRDAYIAGVVKWRDFFVEGAHRRVALIAVFDAAQISAVAFGVVQKTHEIADAHHVNGPAQLGTVVHRHGQAHVAAVAAAGDRHTRAVDARVRGQPVQECAPVLD